MMITPDDLHHDHNTCHHGLLSLANLSLHHVKVILHHDPGSYSHAQAHCAMLKDPLLMLQAYFAMFKVPIVMFKDS